MSSSGFQFKEFFIEHDQCAMKVNTDGILLGAIADVSNAQQILDLGTGSGLIAIMLAQRTACSQITAIELEPNAYQQAKSNAQASPWAERITVLQGDFLQFNFAKQFDLIVSNPPYFEHSLASRNGQRDLARTASQSHLEWLKKSKDWLTPKGKISFILPFEAANKLIQQAESLSLYCVEKWLICTKDNTPPKRMIATFALMPSACVEKSLNIHQNGQYSPEFKALTKDFYLNF